MNTIEFLIGQSEVKKRNSEIEFYKDKAVFEKEQEMLEGFLDSLKKLKKECGNCRSEIQKLADFMVSEIEGEPSRDESAVDCAIRLLKTRMPCQEHKEISRN